MDDISKCPVMHGAVTSNSGSGTASASDVSTGYDFTMNVDGGTISAP